MVSLDFLCSMLPAASEGCGPAVYDVIKSAQRPCVASGDRYGIATFGQRIQLSKRQRVFHAENSRETAAVSGNVELGRNQNCRLYRCQRRVSFLR